MNKDISQKLKALTEKELNAVNGGVLINKLYNMNYFTGETVIPRIPPIGNPKGPSN